VVGVLLMQHSKVLMQALSVQLLTANNNQARVPSAIPAVSVFGIQVMDHREAEEGWLAVGIRVVVVMLSVYAPRLIQRQMGLLQDIH
jgi:uncharacterized membrane protein